jgi:hypothetical protein
MNCNLREESWNSCCDLRTGSRHEWGSVAPTPPLRGGNVNGRPKTATLDQQFASIVGGQSLDESRTVVILLSVRQCGGNCVSNVGYDKGFKVKQIALEQAGIICDTASKIIAMYPVRRSVENATP